MGPILFAVFVVCSADFLSCSNVDSLTKSFGVNRDKCLEYVDMMERGLKNNQVIVMGTCVWRIVE